jgi:hypothetical protein
MTLDEWLQRLGPGALPIFRRTRNALLELVPRREEITAHDVAQIVLGDPLASFHIMHVLNKKLGSRYGTEVLTVEHALMMQGLGVYLDNVGKFQVVEETPAGQDEEAYRNLCTLARRAQHAAWQARDFGVLHMDIRAEEIQVAALLHYMPGFLLWLRAPQPARKLARLRRKLPVVEAEMQALGITTKQLGLALLAAWSIPDTTLDLLDDKNAERARQTILAACFDIARRADRGWWDENLFTDYVALAGVENTPMELVIATVHANAARVARAENWLPTPPAATWLSMIPGPWPPEPEDEDEAAAPARAASTPGEAVAAVIPVQADAAPASAEEHSVCPMPDKQALRDALKGIESHLDGSYNLNQMSAVILKGLHTGLGLSRIVFAAPAADGLKMRARFTLGIPSDHPLRHFEFKLDGHDLFGQLMHKMQGVWVKEDNREKLWPMVSPAMRSAIGEGDFYAMSLTADSRPIGLIYADRGHGECSLDPHTYTDFKMLCLQAARGLAKVKSN